MQKNEWNEEVNHTAPEAHSAADAEAAPLQESAQKALLRKIWDATSFLIVPVVTVFILLGVVFSLAWVPTGSMEPTLPTKSHFLGIRLPYFFGDPVPDRGDIVMFWSDELDELLVKRVIGLPGETITFSDGYVYVDGEKLEEDYLAYPGQTYPTGNTEVFEVPEGCFFALGDNRTGSYDSRAWYQPYINVDQIKSEAILSVAVLPDCTWRGVHLLV